MKSIAAILLFAAIARAAPTVVVNVKPSDATAVTNEGTNVNNDALAAAVNGNPVRAHVIGAMTVENSVTGNFSSLVQATDVALGNVDKVNRTVVGKDTSLERLQAANSTDEMANRTLPVAPSGQPRVILLDVAATSEATTEASTTTTTTAATTVATEATTLAAASSAAPVVVIVNAASTTTTTTAQPVSDRLTATNNAAVVQPVVIVHEAETLSVDVTTTSTTTAQPVQLVQQPVVVSTFPNNSTSVLVGQPQAVSVNEIAVASSTPRA